ncbi:MAG TPA: hypothetical protein VGJ29_13990 [Vicinamibacterales bacterium]
MAAADVNAHPNPTTNVYAARMAAMAKQGVHFDEHDLCGLSFRNNVASAFTRTNGGRRKPAAARNKSARSL